MPTDDGFGFYDMQRVAPARPCTSQERPEQPIKTIQSRFGPFPLQDGDLLAKREDFDRNISTTLEEDTGRGNQGQEKSNHAIIISSRCSAARWHVTASG